MILLNFPNVNNYKFLYYRGKDQNPVYEIWEKDYFSLDQLGHRMARKHNKEWYSYFPVGHRIRKEFKPIPNQHEKQQDGFYHAYIEII